MKQVVVAIYDVKACVFSRPAFVGTEGVAIRSFQDEVQSTQEPRGDLQKHPDDFALYFLGVYDDVGGKFECPDVPRLLISGSSVKA